MDESSTPPSFPFPIFAAALIKDTLDLFLTMTGVGIAVVLPITGFMDIIITVWALQRGSSMETWRKQSNRGMWRKWLTSIFGEAIPFVGVLPMTSWFVYSTYRGEQRAFKQSDTGVA